MDTGNNNKFNERYYIPRAFIKIADKLNIELLPVLNYKSLKFISSQSDGLIITGSNIDVNPEYYGEAEKYPDYTAPIDEYSLDRFTIQHFQNKPILGICGGIQELNVYYGGTLKKVKGHREPHIHKINITSKYLENILEVPNTTIEVNSYHSWSVDKLGRNLEIAATAEDGTIESIISTDHSKLGIQWHPEIMEEKDWKPIFNWLELQI